jgi:hypothetical protein
MSSPFLSDALTPTSSQPIRFHLPVATERFQVDDHVGHGREFRRLRYEVCAIRSADEVRGRRPYAGNAGRCAQIRNLTYH